MCALVPPLFPNFGWPSTGEYNSYYLSGDNLNDGGFLDFPVPEETYGAVTAVAHNQNSFGGSVSSEGNELGNSPVVIKKLNHNASERDRRKKINSLFSSLRSCLPASDQSKKLSIPATVSRSLKYIPELQEQVKKLIKKKEELLVQVSGQRNIEHHVKPQPKAVVTYASTVSATRLGDSEVMVQISSSKVHNFSISNVLSGLEADGFVLVDISSSRSQGERLFHTLHLQVEKIENQKLNCEELSQRILYLYEECGNSLR
ncbi:transcription factor ORG3 [Capsella rubella]|nr:transcription factor ORG3 [Capsella rubella]